MSVINLFGNSNPLRPTVFGRAHETVLFTFYTALTSSILWLAPQKHLVEAGTASVWGSFLLAISFTEAWVKFRAPFFPKYVAVDVGRYVFSALQHVELALAGSLWLRRLTAQPTAVASGNSAWLATASISLLFKTLWVNPRLFLRAKAKVVEGFSSRTDQLSQDQKATLSVLQADVDSVQPLPSSTWHAVYGVLELVNVVALFVFAWKQANSSA